MGAQRPNYPIESVENALRLLLLIEQQRSVRVSQVSAALGVAVSTAHRLLAMLEYYGFVRKNPESKAYVPGPVLVRIGVSSLQGMDVRSQVRPFLEELSREVDETVHLVVLEGRHVLFLDGVESQKAVRVVARTGLSMWAHCTSAGKALLAEMDEDALVALYPDEQLPTLTAQSIASRSVLFAELESVRRQGFAHNSEESEVGVGSIGVAIRNRHDDVVAALSVAAPLSRLSGHRFLNEVASRAKQTVAEIARTLP